MTSDRRKKPLAVLVDFDGTITTADIGDQVVIKFAEPGWENALLRFKAGEINVRELWSYEISLLRKNRESEAVTYSVNSAEIRKGFREFVEYCYAQKIKIEVASSGMNFYVDSILEANVTGRRSSIIVVVSVFYKPQGLKVNIKKRALEKKERKTDNGKKERAERC